MRVGYRLLIIGAGNVAKVVAHQCARYKDQYAAIMVASRTLGKCEAIAQTILDRYGVVLQTAQVDASETSSVLALIRRYRPDAVLHVALPYQNLSIMQACVEARVHYIDTANYESPSEAKFAYGPQWAYDEAFAAAGIQAVLGCGFDPGVTGIFTSYAAQALFDEIHQIDITDCNAGDHGYPFATNFNAEINIREITQPARYYADRKWHSAAAHSISQLIDYPNVGQRNSYLLYHEELESLVRHFPSIQRACFWMTFSDTYLQYLKVIQDIGMASIEPLVYQGQSIVPLQFLQAVLPQGDAIGEHYQGETSIVCRYQGVKGGEVVRYMLWNNCAHGQAYEQTGTQAIAYTTGVPAELGTRLLLSGQWKRQPGVHNVEQFDAKVFLDQLPEAGLVWHCRQEAGGLGMDCNVP